MKQKLLWIGDAGCPSGFARATHEILDVLRQSYDITVLGMNYRGDPHDYSYPIYAAAAEGDPFGISRLGWMCAKVRPDVIVLQNDGWNVPAYMMNLRRRLDNGEYANPGAAAIPVIAVVAVDGKNFDGRWLEGVALAVFWTEFGLREARDGGYTGPALVIPLGVDRRTYYPMDKAEARERRLGKELAQAFIVGNVNRNQPRKRWDLTIRYFARWVHEYKVKDAYLYLHTAPTGDMGVDVEGMARYYGVLDRLALMRPPTWYGIPEDGMRHTYNVFDAQMSTTQGEGFGLTTFEGMACGVPQLVPAWSALGELCKGAAQMVPCSSTAVGPPYVNVLGGVADERAFVEALNKVYRDESLRTQLIEVGLERVGEARFQWPAIGRRYFEAVEQVLGASLSEETWKDLGRPEEVSV